MHYLGLCSSVSSMVAQSSREVMKCRVDTMVIGSHPPWVLVRPSVKRATPQSKNALWIRSTVNILIGTVFRVVWYTSAIQESIFYTLRSQSDVLYEEVAWLSHRPKPFQCSLIHNHGKL